MDFIFGNHKGEERFTFNVQVHCVQPWVQLKSKGRLDERTSGLILKWNRDNKRSGISKVAFAEAGDGTSDGENAAPGTIYFNELFEIPATLHKEHAGHRMPGRSPGPDDRLWQKKTVILTLHEATSDGQAKEPPLGRGVLDLAEFAARDGDIPVGKFVKLRLAVSRQIEKANDGQPIHIEATITCLSTKAKKAIQFEKSKSMKSSEKSRSEQKKPASKSGLSPAVQILEQTDQDLIDSLLDSEGESDGELSSQTGRVRQRESRPTEIDEEDEGQSSPGMSAAGDHSENDDSDLDFMTEDDLTPVATPKPPNPSTPSTAASIASSPDRGTSKDPGKSQPPAALLKPDLTTKLKLNGEAKAADSALRSTALKPSIVQPHPDYGEGVSDGAVVSAAVGKAGMAMPQGKPQGMRSKPGTENGKMSLAVLDAAEKVRLAQDRAMRAETRVLKLEGELRDCATLEVAIHTAVSVHGQTAHKMHTPARRLARAYIQARGNGLWPPEIAAGTARNSVAGLILAARACGDDVGRLLFWWSNCVVLREMVAAAFGIEMRIAEERTRNESTAGASTSAAAPKLSAEIREAERFLKQGAERASSGKPAPAQEPGKSDVNKGDKGRPSSSGEPASSATGLESSKGPAKPGSEWKTAPGYCDALKRTEAWICGKILQLVWWQVMNPPMQPGYRNKAETIRVADDSAQPASKKELFIDVSKVPIGRTDRAPPSKGPKVDKKGQIIGSNGKVVGFKSKAPVSPSRSSSDVASEQADASDVESPSTSSVKTPTSSRTRNAGAATESRLREGDGGASPSSRLQNGNGSGNGNGNENANGENGDGKGSKKQGSKGGQGCEESPIRCVELWKGVLLEVERLCCPARAQVRECGCLHVLTQQVLEHCIARLDVALFNALLRDPRIDGPTDPISDPLTEPRALPIPAGKLTFGGGVQLKIAIKAWTDWLPQLLSGELVSRAESAGSPPSSPASTCPPLPEPFPYLRAAADLLMLPKEMLMDRAVRKEVCGRLTLPLIRRVLYLFVPDYHAPEAVPASLLAAFNAEVSMEKRRQGEADMGPSYLYNAPAAPCTYAAAPSAPLRARFGKDYSADATLDARGYSSDDEVDQAERPLQLLVDGLRLKKEGERGKEGGNGGGEVEELRESEGDEVERYQLLRRIWQPAR